MRARGGGGDRAAGPVRRPDSGQWTPKLPETAARDVVLLDDQRAADRGLCCHRARPDAASSPRCAADVCILVRVCGSCRRVTHARPGGLDARYYALPDARCSLGRWGWTDGGTWGWLADDMAGAPETATEMEAAWPHSGAGGPSEDGGRLRLRAAALTSASTSLLGSEIGAPLSPLQGTKNRPPLLPSCRAVNVLVLDRTCSGLSSVVPRPDPC